MPGRNPGDLLPSADGEINVERVELDHPRDASGALGGQDCRAAAAERIEDDAVAPTTVSDQISDEGHRFDRRVQIEVAAPCRVQAVDTRIVEHIGTVSALPAEPEIIDVRSHTVFEYGDQLVLRAVKAALAGIALVPDQKVFPLGVERPSGGQQLGKMPPVDKDEMDRAVDAGGDGLTNEGLEERGKSRLRHLACGHLEFTMARLTSADSMAVDGHVARG